MYEFKVGDLVIVQPSSVSQRRGSRVNFIKPYYKIVEIEPNDRPGSENNWDGCTQTCRLESGNWWGNDTLTLLKVKFNRRRN